MAANEKQFKESELKEAIAWSLAHLMKEVDEKVEDTTTKGYILKLNLRLISNIVKKLGIDIKENVIYGQEKRKKEN